MLLHAQQDDFRLNALYDTERTAMLNLSYSAYLVDEAGNRLTDTQGNYLLAYYPQDAYPQKLHADKDDFNLRA